MRLRRARTPTWRVRGCRRPAARSPRAAGRVIVAGARGRARGLDVRRWRSSRRGKRLRTSFPRPCESRAPSSTPPRAADRRSGPATSLLGSLELLRAGRRFDRASARPRALAAAQLRPRLRAFDAANGTAGADPTERLALAGDALARGARRGTRRADEVVRLAARASGAAAAQLWRLDDEGGLERLASTGRLDDARRRSSRAADRATSRSASRRSSGRHASPRSRSASLRSAPPARVRAGKLAVDERDIDRLATFAVRAAHALRSGERARATSLELERPRRCSRRRPGDRRALPGAHAGDGRRGRLRAARADRVADLPRRRDRLRPRGRGLDGRRRACGRRTPPRARVRAAARPGRARTFSDAAGRRPARTRSCGRGRSADRRWRWPFRSSQVTSSSACSRSTCRAGGDRGGERGDAPVGARRPAGRGRRRTRELHERDRAPSDRAPGDASPPSGKSAKRLRAQYEISRSFAQSLSLDATLDSVTTSVVELLDVDAAVDPRARRARRPARRPGRRTWPTRGCEALRPRARARRRRSTQLPNEPLMVDRRQRAGSAAVLARWSRSSSRARPRSSSRLQPGRAAGHADGRLARSELGGSGTSRSRPPLSSPGRRARDRQRAPLPAAEGLRRHDAALAAPARGCPSVEGLEVGDVYESSARVEVGGDVYDFLTLARRRGSPSCSATSPGTGSTATADMAMAKFVFRSLVREHPDPADVPRAGERGRRRRDRAGKLHDDGLK